MDNCQASLLILHGWKSSKEKWNETKKYLESEGIKVVIPAGGKRFKREETCWMDFQPEYNHLFDEAEKAVIERRS